MSLKEKSFHAYLDFVEKNQNILFKHSIKTPSDAIGDIKKESYWFRGNFSLRDDGIDCESSESWKKEEDHFIKFHFMQCPCGNLYCSDNGKKRPWQSAQTILSEIPKMHIVTCLELAKKVDKVNGGKIAISHLVKYHQCIKRSNKKILLTFDGYDNVVPIKKDVISSKKIERNKYSKLCNDFLASSLIVDSPSKFPELPGIYFIQYYNKGEWHPLYIGESVNLKNRWKQHHRTDEVNFLMALDIDIEFRYIAETPFLKFPEPLTSIESKLIEEFRPKLNQKKVSELPKVNSDQLSLSL